MSNVPAERWTDDVPDERLAKTMSLTEFAEVLNYARKNNSPHVTRLIEIPCVKYIHPSIDLRTDTVFSITFRGFGGGEKVLHCQNEERLNPVSLRDRCMSYLKGILK